MCEFSDSDGAEHWQSRFDGSRIRVSINGVLVHERDDAIAAERERCADACIQIASELAKAANLASKDKVLAKSQADILFAESCIAIDCARKIRGAE